MSIVEPGSWLWQWLANQPPFIDVGIGMVFVLVLAPGVLFAVARLLTRLEPFLESLSGARSPSSAFASGSKPAGKRRTEHSDEVPPEPFALIDTSKR
jgi:hypothetical protein